MNDLISRQAAIGGDGDNPCHFCAYYMDSFLNRACRTCSEGIEEWLKQEAKEDAAD